MNHKIKSLILIFVFVAMIAIIGLLVGQGGITGASTTAHSIACFEDADCDDKISATEDICKNPATEYALCVNKPRVN